MARDFHSKLVFVDATRCGSKRSEIHLTRKWNNPENGFNRSAHRAFSLAAKGEGHGFHLNAGCFYSKGETADSRGIVESAAAAGAEDQDTKIFGHALRRHPTVMS